MHLVAYLARDAPRSGIVRDDGAIVDVERASRGRLPSEHGTLLAGGGWAARSTDGRRR